MHPRVGVATQSANNRFSRHDNAITTSSVATSRNEATSYSIECRPGNKRAGLLGRIIADRVTRDASTYTFRRVHDNLLFGHVCRMEVNRKLKTLTFGIADGTNKRGRPCREWMDDIVSWCKTGLQELNSLAQDRRKWKLVTTQAMDTNGRWSHGS